MTSTNAHGITDGSAHPIAMINCEKKKRKTLLFQRAIKEKSSDFFCYKLTSLGAFIIIACLHVVWGNGEQL